VPEHSVSQKPWEFSDRKDSCFIKKAAEETIIKQNEQEDSDED